MPALTDRRLARLPGIAIPLAVWALGVVPPPRDGLTPEYLASYTLPLAALILVDQTAPGATAPLWRRLAWLVAELALCFDVVRVHGTLIRPALVYLVPATRTLLLFGERRGLAASLSVWFAYALNVAGYAWPDRLGEYPNYLSFFLGPYVLAVALTVSTLRQAAGRRAVQDLYDELRSAHEELKALHQRVRETAVAEERNRLAREIHDSLAHYLTVVNVQLEAAEKLGAEQRGPEAQDQVRRARRLTLECLQEVRRSVAALRAASIEELSLPHALRRLVAEFGENTGLEVRLNLRVADDERLAPDVALALYRAAQEGLTNVHRHARARRVTVSLSRQQGRLRLAIVDDGRGPQHPDAERRGDGFGLLGLRERVELLGGEVGFGAAAPTGSRLSVVVPA